MRTLIVATGIICLAAGFVAGKLTQSTTSIQNPITISTEHQELNLGALKLTESKSVSATAGTFSKKTADASKNCSPNAENLATSNKENLPSTAASNQPATLSAPDISNKLKLKFTTTTELSNESVDELVPKPFNNAIKNMHGPFKDKYAEFLASDEKNEWAENAENYLNDALNNGMLGNSMEINSIKCQASLCEVRVYEREANTAITNINKQLSNFTNYFQQSQMSTSSDENKRTYITYLMLAKDAKQ